ncbi:hypothetical protein XH98_06240 [Bradyrhizobium sp. CCBAU 51745]|nr:type II toxin-antitoxin system RelE/ParE family toxin [Bradyrhizobium sp. CCBAU 51745]MDA9438730.1 hypothetical protein [Bradyrhizobium sp. CCBAU 51745]
MSNGDFRCHRSQCWFQRSRLAITLPLGSLGADAMGDVKPVSEAVSELRIDYGPGYRIYFIQQGNTAVILLCGGDKRTQNEDIRTAKRMAKEV